MSTTPATLFARLRGKARSGILVEGIGVGLAVVIAFTVVSFALDRTLRLETVYRACLLVVLVAALWNVLRKSVLRPIRFELTDDELALAMERGEDLQQALISAVQFERVVAGGNPGRESTELMQRVIDDVHGRVAGLRNDAALDLARVRKFGAIILGCLAVVGTWAVLDHGSLVLWAKRNLFMSDEDWPRRTTLAFAMDGENGVVRVPEGNDLTVEVHAAGLVPDQVFIEYEYQDGTNGRQPMALSGGEGEASGRFTWLLESVISNVTLHAIGGDARRQTLHVQLVTRPKLQDLVITKTYPAYMKVEPEKIRSSEGDVRLPAGVTLDISGRSTKELESAYLTFGQDAKIGLEVDRQDSTFKGRFVPAKSGVLTLDVTDRDGLGAHKPPKLFLRVVQDAAPTVEFKTLGIGSMILYKAVIPGTLRIRDDFGITRLVSKIRVSNGMADQAGKGKPEDVPWEVVPFQDMRQPNTAENEVEYEERVSFDLLSRNDANRPANDPKNPIRPGMLLAISFEAQDNFGPGEPHLGKSETLTLRVVDEEKLMQDLHRRQLERRRELTQILDKEKSYKDEVAEIVSPSSSDSRAKLARLRLGAIARDQLALQKQLIGVAQRYKLILDEYFNNRILKPTEVTRQRQAIQQPLERLSKEDFPTSAQEVDDFARQGLEDQRTVAVATYSGIIQVLQAVIDRMRYLENIAGILEDVKRIRDLEHRVESETRKALDREDKGAGRVKKDGAPPDPKKPGTGARKGPDKLP